MTVAEFDIAGAPLKETLAVVASNHKVVTHWTRREDTLIFFWSKPEIDDAHPLPAPMKVEDCEGFVRSALTTMEYPPEPDCDGSVSKSWRIRHRLPASSITLRQGSWYVAFVVTPHWNEYHK